MIQKVNKLTIFKNYFTPTGRIANKEIKNIRETASEYADIYQKKLSQGIIVLQHETKSKNTNKTKTLFLNSNGVENITERENTSSENGFKLISILKRYLPSISLHERQVLINTKTRKIEEKANRYSGLGRGSNTTVISYGNRESEFPATELARSIHPSIAQKIIFDKGGFGYNEMYIQL